MQYLGFRLRIFLIILAAIILAGTLGFMLTEGLSFTDAFYFSIVTVATVGYGDISPVTTAGKVLSLLLIIFGVGTFLGVVANATEIFLSAQEKKMRKEKLNMVMDTFFSEAGTRLLTMFVDGDPHADNISNDLLISNDWPEEQFSAAGNRVKKHEFSIDINRIDLAALREFLAGKTNLLLRLLENPHILEHESFTDVLRACSHLKNELLYREDLQGLPESDYAHLAGDIKRAYSLLVIEWLDYMHYLKKNYPYLFSLAIRLNPFNKNRSPLVT